MKYLIIALFLTGCKASQPTFLTLKTTSPSENFTTYWFSNGCNELRLVDTVGAYEFPDTIFLIKNQQK
jgi:hypothetical protein